MVDMEQAQTREWESRQEQWKAKFEEYEKEMTDKMDKIKVRGVVLTCSRF